MFWIYANRFLLWAPPAAAAAYSAVLTIAAGAAETNPQAGVFLDQQIEMLDTAMNSKALPFILAAIVVLWLAAFIFTDRRSNGRKGKDVKMSKKPSHNTFVDAEPGNLANGSHNTVVRTTDPNGNLRIDGGTAIGSHARADGTSVAIGSHANSGKKPDYGE